MCPLLGIWFSIKLAKIANLEFYCSLKMGWQPAIWPPTMKYLLLTSHFSDCLSGRGLASAAYLLQPVCLLLKNISTGLCNCY